MVQLHPLFCANQTLCNQKRRAWPPSLVLDSSLTHPTIKSDTMHFETEMPYPHAHGMSESETLCIMAGNHLEAVVSQFDLSTCLWEVTKVYLHA